MRTPLPPRSAVLAALRCLGCAAVGGLLMAVVPLGACTNPDGQTPTCINNVDQTGTHPVDGGCVQFAPCDKGPPAACCTDTTGAPLTGNALSTCLYGYGGCVTFTVTTDANGRSVYTCDTGEGTGGGEPGDAGPDSGGGPSDGG